jgi:hypothetical protein
MNSQVDTEIDGPTLPAVSSPTFRTVIAKFKQFLKFDRELQRKIKKAGKELNIEICPVDGVKTREWRGTCGNKRKRSLKGFLEYAKGSPRSVLQGASVVRGLQSDWLKKTFLEKSVTKQQIVVIFLQRFILLQWRCAIDIEAPFCRR